MAKKVRGRIIRVLDSTSVIINLGSEDGVQTNSIFNILGQPEAIKDPFSQETLGYVNVVKAKVGAASIDEKFTIATTERASYMGLINRATLLSPFRGQLEEDELLVEQEEVQPWKARSEAPVRVGDYVEVEVPESLSENMPA
ncbi:MAG: hypothetical protein AB1791_00880 [Chloroflexota bacterium]